MAHMLSILLLASGLLLACLGQVMAQPRKVFAHYMQYADVDIGVYKREIQLAQSKGIDAFALNTNVWRQNLADRMFQAAQELGTDFKLFFSADLHSDANGHLSTDDLIAMLGYISHPNQMFYEGKSLFTTWLGGDTDWNDIFQRAGGKDKFFMVPFFPTDGSPGGVQGMLSQWGSTIDGLFAWDTSAWNPSDALNSNYLSACKAAGKTFMASVSPWFFKTQPYDVCQVKANYQGPGLWLTKWKEVIDLNIPLVEVVTWNDWAESSYVGPQFTALGAAANVTDFPHQAYLELSTYYIQWYKSGNPPTISSNGMFMFYTTQSKNAGGDCQMKDVLEDRLYVTTMLTQPTTLVLTSGSATQSFHADAGINTYSMNFQPGQQSASFSEQATLVGQQNVLSDGDVGASNFNVYSIYMKF